MNKWIRAGNLPPMPVTAYADQTELEDMSQLTNEMEVFLLNLFRQRINPELTESENLKRLTAAARKMLAILKEQGLGTATTAKQIALEAMGKSSEAIVCDMLSDDMFQERIRSLAWTEETLFPIRIRTDEMEDIPETPADWAELITTEPDL